MANDNCSGIAVATELGPRTAGGPRRRFTYRLLFIPGTIGSITWLARNAATVDRIRHGLVLTGLGDRGQPTYKRSRRGDAAVDRAAARALAETGRPHRVVDFSPYGYDERQFCSPGFDLPVGRFGRSQHGEYPEYHTSADNLDFVTPESLADSFALLSRTIEICEADRVWRNTSPYGEPQLGRRGLYRSIGATMNRASIEMGLLWVLNLADGSRSLLDIAERADLPFDAVADAAGALAGVGLLVEDTPPGRQDLAGASPAEPAVQVTVQVGALRWLRLRWLRTGVARADRAVRFRPPGRPGRSCSRPVAAHGSVVPSSSPTSAAVRWSPTRSTPPARHATESSWCYPPR